MLDVIILTRCQDGLIYNCLNSIAKFTAQETLDKCCFIVGYTGDDDKQLKSIEKYIDGLGLNFKTLKMEYNFAKCNNLLADLLSLNGMLLFMNDDVQLTEDAISYCLDCFKRDIDDILGTVGIKLLFRDGTIQHAGLYIQTKDECKFRGVSHMMLRKPDLDLPDMFTVGNTGAFLMMKKSLFLSCGKFNESYKHCFEDVELNFKCLAAGKLNVTLCSHSAYHFESLTRNQAVSREDVGRLVSFFNSNSSLILQNRELYKSFAIDIT